MRSQVISSRCLPAVLLSLLVLLTACGQSTTTATSPAVSTPTTAAIAPITVDAYGAPIAFPSKAPQRIVSLVPNVSEMLGVLSLQKRVVAVDAYTDYPPDLASLPKVSSGMKYNTEQILLLKPDLVLSYGGDTKQYDSQLKNLGLNVVDLPSATFSQVLQEIQTVGRLTFTQDMANKVVTQLQQQIDQVKSTVAGSSAPKVMIELDYSTPGKPYVFGGGSFGDELLQDANAQNIFSSDSSGGGYPQVTDEAVISANPQFIILTEDPAYGGNPDGVYKRAAWSAIDAVRFHKVYHLNSNLVGRPGPRLVEGLRCIAQVIHPDKYPGNLPAYCTASV